MNPTQLLKSELWKRFGSQGHPAEWDGNVYGGGKLSQRYWEYFKALELLSINKDSVLLDIGGGSPVTGVGFLSSLLSLVARKVVIMDPNISSQAVASESLEFVRKGGRDELKNLLGRRSDISHIVSVSVFEHIEPALREAMMHVINEFFTGDCLVATFEYHASHTFFDSQLTARSVSRLFSPLTKFYLDEFVASPVWCENAFGPNHVPGWYPVAVRFVRTNS